MNVLVLSNNPNRASFRQRIGVYLDILSTSGINCEVVKLPSTKLARLKLFKQTTDFDAVFLHKKCLNFLDAHYLRKHAKKLIYDFDDAVMYSPNTPASDRTSHFRLFRRTAKLADMIIAGNCYLAEHAKRFNDNVKVLPTGLSTKAYDLSIKPKDDGKIRLVWIGSKSTLRYLEQIRPALEEIGTRFEKIVLRIICDEFFDLENMEVEKCVWSLASQAKDLATSHIGLAPLPSNRFTRGKCGFKVLQYAAAGLPVIASPVGVNSEYVVNGITGYHAFGHLQWVDRICECVENEGLRKELGDTAKKLVGRFDCDVIGGKLSRFIAGFSEEPLECAIRPQVKDIRAIPILQRGKPKVSICIPTYNRKDYLQETLESIFAQTYKDYEIVIVDDGSTDGTEEMIKNLDFPVTYYWQKNQGEPAARNKLIELAVGEYITFIDSDDLLFSDAVEELLNLVEDNDSDVVAYSSYVGIDETGKEVKRKSHRQPSGYIAAELFEYIYVHSCGTMCKKKLLEEAGGFDVSLPVCSPYALWLKLSLKYKFVPTVRPTFKRRRHSDNLSEYSFANRKIELNILEYAYRKDFADNGKEIITPRRAMKRLSKESYRAGRCALREKAYKQAWQLLDQSFRQHPNLKSLIYWIRAMIAKRLVS